MYEIREYNQLRVDWFPLKYQYKAIRKFFGDKLIGKPHINTEDKRYITFYVRCDDDR